MRKHLTLFLASLLLGVTLPVTTSALYMRDQIRTTNGVQKIRAAAVIKKSRRADFSLAMSIYQALLQKGQTGLTKPDINDPVTYLPYIKAYPEGLQVDVEPKATKPVTTTDHEIKDTDELSIQELTDQERQALHQSIKVGRCWGALEQFSPGFEALCRKLTNGRIPSNTTGLQSDLVKLRK